ncbi:hypothetical protein [Luteimonas sp. A482]
MGRDLASAIAVEIGPKPEMHAGCYGATKRACDIMLTTAPSEDLPMSQLHDAVLDAAYCGGRGLYLTQIEVKKEA